MGAKVNTAVASFHTTTDALAFKEAAVQEGLNGRLAPIPRQLSAGCGIAWREPHCSAAKLLAFADEHHLSTEEITELLL